MKRPVDGRIIVATGAVLVIALSILSMRRTVEEIDAARDVQTVIRRQLDAFKRDDYRAAYRFAAPEIQERFPLADFRRMVKESYPQIARSRSVVVGTPKLRGAEATVVVTVTGQDGLTLPVIYLLQRERDGWRIAGVDDGRPHVPSPSPAPKPGGGDVRKEGADAA